MSSTWIGRSPPERRNHSTPATANGGKRNNGKTKKALEIASQGPCGAGDTGRGSPTLAPPAPGRVVVLVALRMAVVVAALEQWVLGVAA
ncbi:MAG TPA: hypothetical protein VFE78_23360, partial [Gemmataceae bacterium]|nr:hypothetical protein [Gemmataceae bacterium]